MYDAFFLYFLEINGKTRTILRKALKARRLELLRKAFKTRGTFVRKALKLQRTFDSNLTSVATTFRNACA